MLKFIHLTDLHLTGSGEASDGYDTLIATERALGHAVQLFPDSAFIVITGDLANWGERAAYLKLQSLLHRIEMPVYLMIGNHDNRANFLRVFGSRHPFALPYIQYVDTVGDYRLIFLDSQTPGTHGGAFTPDRLAWIDRQLTEADRDVLLFMHHHPVAVGAPSLDAKGLRNWPEFHTILARHRHKIRHIFHGHCHTLLQGNVAGISFTGLRSMGAQAYTDLKTDKACRWYVEPHYAIVLVEANSLVTHVHEFNYSGPLIRRDRQNFEDFIALCAERGVEVPRTDPAPRAAD
jgi:3',5'-cyclic AMP phosphodiesterase CpdA